MEQLILKGIETNSLGLVISAILTLTLYYVIKNQRDKTSVKRDKQNHELEVKIALQDKDIENLKGQVEQLFGRWDFIQDLLSKINENLSGIREKITNLDERIDRLERLKDRER